MSEDFVLTQAQLLDIATALKEKMVEGVHHFGEELRCLPTYIPIMQVPEYGRTLVVVFGGNTIKTAIASLSLMASFFSKKAPSSPLFRSRRAFRWNVTIF